ncbi:unnamed protein product [Urochloa humidicola]
MKAVDADVRPNPHRRRRRRRGRWRRGGPPGNRPCPDFQFALVVTIRQGELRHAAPACRIQEHRRGPLARLVLVAGDGVRSALHQRAAVSVGAMWVGIRAVIMDAFWSVANTIVCCTRLIEDQRVTIAYG